MSNLKVSEPCNPTIDKDLSNRFLAIQHGYGALTSTQAFVLQWSNSVRSRPVDFDLGARYVENSIRVDSLEFKKIQNTASDYGIAVSLGFSERVGDSVYISQALITQTGDIAMKRRKLKPTHMERTIFGDASGDCLAPVIKLAAGESGETVNVGSLSCWEHIQPLLKYYTFSQGEQIHVAAWPPLDPCPDESPGLFSMSVDGE